MTDHTHTLTDTERDTLGPFIWGGGVGVARGKEAEYSRDLLAAVERIKADAYAAGLAARAAATPDNDTLRAMADRWVAEAEELADEGDEASQAEAFVLRACADDLRAVLSADPTPTEEPEAWIDKHGDIWREGDDGLMHTPETAPFPREHVERKWGPLRPADPTPTEGADQ